MDTSCLRTLRLRCDFMKVSPEPAESVRSAAGKSDGTDYSKGSGSPAVSEDGLSFCKGVKGPKNTASVRGFASVRPAEAGWRREMNMSTLGSGRGHDLDGGGLTVGQGQLAQTRDRNFDGVFSRCREAIAAIRATVIESTCCKSAFAELDDAVWHVDCMLNHVEIIFGGDSNRTIVSLKHLCVQLESTREEAKVYIQLPQLSCIQMVLLCGGGSKRLAELEREGEVDIRKQTKATVTYATAFLIEHGYRASELKEFAHRQLPDGSQPPAAIAHGGQSPLFATLHASMIKEESETRSERSGIRSPDFARASPDFSPHHKSKGQTWEGGENMGIIS